MANDKPFKIKNSLQAGRYLGTNGTSTSGSVSYTIAGLSYDNKSADVSGETTVPIGLAFKPDGTKMYVFNYPTDTLYQYALSTAWDASTAAYDSKSFVATTQVTEPRNVDFKPDGSEMTLGDNADDIIYQYTLSTAWDISTASYASKSLDVSANVSTMGAHVWGDSGNKLYVSDTTSTSIYQYNLTTAYDLSTASYASKSFDVSSFQTAPFGLAFKNDGTTLVVLDNTDDALYQYTLGTAWDISTCSSTGYTYDLSSEDGTPYVPAFGDSGNKLFVLGNVGDAVYQYSSTAISEDLDLSSGTNFSFTPSTAIDFTFSNPPASGKAIAFTVDITGSATSASTEDIVPITGLYLADYESVPFAMAFNDDGTKFYTCGTGNNGRFNEYNLAEPYSLDPYNSASHVSTFTIYDGSTVTETQPRGIAFKTDGTKVYTCGTTNLSAYEFTLSTAWDISTASFSTSIAVNGQSAIQFKPDGTKMYVLSDTNDDIYQYSLSTAWDLSTATYDSVSFDTTSQDSTMYGFYLSSDGTKFWTTGQNSDDVHEYAMSTAYDLSTASHTVSTTNDDLNTGNVYFAQAPRGILLNPDETKMYVTDGTKQSAIEFNMFTSSIPTITWPTNVEWEGGTAPSIPDYRETARYTFLTKDGGTTYYGKLAGATKA